MTSWVLTARAATGRASVSMFHQQHLARVQRRASSQQTGQQGKTDLARVAAEQHRHRGLDPAPKLLALIEGMGEGFDPAVQQHDIRGRPGRITATGGDPIPTLAARIAASLAPSPTIAVTRPARSMFG